ncbi:MAG: GYF domain-containing protein [Phycisphaerales bacterium JB037]
MAPDSKAMQYLVRHEDGTESGPYSASALKSLAQNGRVGSEDLISPVGSDRWAKAYKVKGLGIERTLSLADEQGQWLYQLDDAEIGPVSSDVIRQVLRGTKQGLDTPIRRPHERGWHPASYFGEFTSVESEQRVTPKKHGATIGKRVRWISLGVVVIALLGYFVIVTVPE